ncbi:MAG: LptF/LptG family permease [Planctomycetes bacterium]|nr:LptF/LptG family permease [Planctomycetota bacterium]
MILQKYITRELLTAFFLTISVFLSVVILIIPFSQFQKHTALDSEFLLKILPFFVVMALGYVIPLALLISTIFVFGRLTEDNELIALKSSGIHPGRIILPVVLLGVFFAVIVVFINTRLAPYCSGQTRNLSISAFKSMVFSPIPSAREIRLPNYHIGCTNSAAGNIFENVRILKFDLKTDALLEELYADTAEFQIDEENAILSLNLKKVSDTIWTPTGGQTGSLRATPQIMQSDTMSYQLDVSSLFLPRRKNLGAMSQRELDEMVRLNQTERFRLAEILTEKYRRLAMGLTPLIFILIGTPFGILIRHGNRVAAVAISAIIVFGGYYPVTMFGNFLGSKELLPPLVSVWLANMIMAVAGIGLIYFIIRYDDISIRNLLHQRGAVFGKGGAG